MCRLIFAIDDGLVVFLYFNHVVWLRDGLIVEWWVFFERMGLSVCLGDIDIFRTWKVFYIVLKFLTRFSTKNVTHNVNIP